MLIGTIKATHSVANLLQNSSYFGRLVQNAQRVKAAEKPPVKPTWEKIEGMAGNTAGFMDPNTQRYVPVPYSALGSTFATSTEEVQDNRAELAKQSEQTAINDFAKELINDYGNTSGQNMPQGEYLDESGARVVAKRITEIIKANPLASPEALFKTEVPRYLAEVKKGIYDLEQGKQKAINSLGAVRIN